MTRIVGLDLSLTSTGVAVTNGRQIELARVTSKPEGTRITQRSTRLRRLVTMIFGHVVNASYAAQEAGEPLLVVIEGPSYGSDTSHTWDRAGLWWLLIARLTGQDIPVAVVPPASLKTYATGKGNAPKDAVLAAAVRTFPRTSLDGNDEADALWCAAMGARHLGCPIDSDPLPAVRARGLAKVEFPTL